MKSKHLSALEMSQTSGRDTLRGKLFSGLAATSLLLTLVSTATAADRYVLPSGINTNNDCLDSASPCKTIKRAVRQADSGDTIILMQESPSSPTTFSVKGVGISKDLTFRGEGADPADTILDADHSDRHFAIEPPAANVGFENMTLENGDSASLAGSIYMTSGGLLNLDRVIFRNNRAETSGGALTIDGTLTAVQTTFDNNQAETESGGAIHLRTGSAMITDSTFTTNTADEGSGGGLYVEDGTAELEGVQMEANTATDGGAIACRVNLNEGTGCSYLQVDNESRFSLNIAQDTGGAIFTQADSLIEESDFVENSTSSDSFNADGGAIYANVSDDNAQLLIKKSGFAHNSAGGSGGAVATRYSNVRIRRSTFRQNDAGTSGVGNGGAIQFSDPQEAKSLEMINSTFSANSASNSAGAIDIDRGINNKLLSLTLVDNSASGCVGCAQDLNGGAEMSRVLIDHPNQGAGGPECSSSFGFTGENNLIPTDSCGDEAGFRVIGNAGTLTFGQWGGRTRTYMITSGSAAFGNGGLCTKFDGSELEIDQRGFARTSGACDIGSFERQ